jgi:hypothetical protein
MSKVKVTLMAVFAIGVSFALDIELLRDVHQANGNKLQKLDGSGV